MGLQEKITMAHRRGRQDGGATVGRGGESVWLENFFFIVEVLFFINKSSVNLHGQMNVTTVFHAHYIVGFFLLFFFFSHHT